MSVWRIQTLDEAIDRDGDEVDVGERGELRVWQGDSLASCFAPGEWRYCDLVPLSCGGDGNRVPAPAMRVVGGRE